MIQTAVIEDSQALASVYRSYLKDTEFSVNIFSSAVSDINRMVKQGGFDLIICPCFPKYQSGSQIAHMIKSDPDLSNSVLMISTSMQQENIRSEWDLRDLDAMLIKPFDKSCLHQQLTKTYYANVRKSRKMPLALVIDDSKAVRHTLGGYLEALNYKVYGASDGMEGLKAASDIHPDLILVDVEMPILDGFDFCRQLSREPELKYIPTIVVSGTIDEAQFTKGFHAGAIDFLEKPVSQKALAAIIESVSTKESSNASGTTMILSRDNTLSSILKKTLNFLNSSINVCSSLAELETYLYVSIPDIVILDLTRREKKLDICRHVREMLHNESTVVIAVADESDRDIMFRCFRYGATEFIIKPFGRDEVRARIENHIKIKKLQDELRQKNRILETLAYKDKLTGLMNRRYFDNALKEELEKAAARQQSLSFVMIDLDNFKQVNDQFGHDIGDLVLREIADIIIDNVSGNAIPCRYGGEEFCILYPETDLETALKNCRKIKRFCSSKTISAHHINQTISGGLASFPGTSAPEDLIADADTCLYKAKKTGKNKIIAQKIL